MKRSESELSLTLDGSSYWSACSEKGYQYNRFDVLPTTQVSIWLDPHIRFSNRPEPWLCKVSSLSTTWVMRIMNPCPHQQDVPHDLESFIVHMVPTQYCRKPTGSSQSLTTTTLSRLSSIIYKYYHRWLIVPHTSMNLRFAPRSKASVAGLICLEMRQQSPPKPKGEPQDLAPRSIEATSLANRLP